VQDFYGTGRRKTSTARVHMKPGNGEVIINGKKLEGSTLEDKFLAYFNNMAWVKHALEPLYVTNTIDKFDFVIRVNGGGKSGQAGAVRLGIARALLQYGEDLKPILKSKKLLTRDPRMVERKKYGLKKARRAPQFSKR
jgi:small subunit ribosomal protein S9